VDLYVILLMWGFVVCEMVSVVSLVIMFMLCIITCIVLGSVSYW